MAIKLGKNPRTFTRDIPLINLDGKTDILKITYIYRSREEFAVLLDERAAAERRQNAEYDKAAKEQAAAAQAAEANGETSEPEPVSAAVAFRKAAAEAAARVLEVAQGWDVEDEFTVENLIRLDADFPGALGDIHDTYQTAVLEVRRKN